ncbi:ras-interacting protein RIP3-like, partial [Homarus americanus]|uniref:ras-interacting protein RIP3-like n=1 Tax=Homarus americanus TaxID=6706 RepID=UPI001C46E6F1
MNRRGGNRAKRTTESKGSGTGGRGARAAARKEGDPAATAPGNDASRGKRGEENYGSLRARRDAVSGDEPSVSAEEESVAVSGRGIASSMPAATVTRTPRVGPTNCGRGAGTTVLSPSSASVREEKQPVHDVCKLPKKRKFDPSELEDMTDGVHTPSTQQGVHTATTQGVHTPTTQGVHIIPTTQGVHTATTQGVHITTTQQGVHITTTSTGVVVPSSVRGICVSTAVSSPMVCGVTAPDAVSRSMACVVNMSESKPQDLRVNAAPGSRDDGQDRRPSGESPVTVKNATAVLTVQRNTHGQGNNQLKLMPATTTGLLTHPAALVTIPHFQGSHTQLQRQKIQQRHIQPHQQQQQPHQQPHQQQPHQQQQQPHHHQQPPHHHHHHQQQQQLHQQSHHQHHHQQQQQQQQQQKHHKQQQPHQQQNHQQEKESNQETHKEQHR